VERQSPDVLLHSDLTRVQPHRWLSAAIFNWLVIAFTFAFLAKFAWPTRLLLMPLALVLIGTRQHSLALLAHDGAHFLCSRNRVVNDTLSSLLCAFPSGASLVSYRRFHFAHHRYTGSSKDPEFEFKGGMGSRWDLPMTRHQMFVQVVKDCFGFGLPDILQTAKTLKPADVRDWVNFVGFWLVVSTSLATAGLAWCIAVWFVALSTFQWAAFRIRIWTEHSGLSIGGTHRFHATWWQRMFLFPVNTWCHYEHHANVAVPFHRLPELRQRMCEEPILSLDEVFTRLSMMPRCQTGRVPTSEILAPRPESSVAS
jgi:fatty acid desaturase